MEILVNRPRQTVILLVITAFSVTTVNGYHGRTTTTKELLETNTLLHSPITKSLGSSSDYKQQQYNNKLPGVVTNEFVLPQFAEPINNITVVAGRDAILHCVIDNLQKFKVAWVRVDTHSILTIHNQVITRNYRIGLVQAGGRNWVLKISNVVESDRGFYMCQINTDPMRYQEAYIEVVVPPDIVDADSSTDTIVREGSNISLTCSARGHPQPNIVWRREDGAAIGRGKTKISNAYDGEVLNIPRVSRLHIGAYLCIASNGVPPSVSKRIMLNVQFAPVLWIPNQLEGTVVGQEVQLVCQIEAYPIPIVYWTTESGEILISSSRLSMKTSLENDYKIIMMLIIRNITRDNFGGYRCVVRNSLGETDGLIRLYEVPAAAHLPADRLEPFDSEMDDSQSEMNHVNHEQIMVSTDGRRPIEDSNNNNNKEHRIQSSGSGRSNNDDSRRTAPSSGGSTLLIPSSFHYYYSTTLVVVVAAAASLFT